MSMKGLLMAEVFREFAVGASKQRSDHIYPRGTCENRADCIAQFADLSGTNVQLEWHRGEIHHL